MGALGLATCLSLALGAASSSIPAVPSSGCKKPRPVRPPEPDPDPLPEKGETRLLELHDPVLGRVQRRYRVHIPPGYYAPRARGTAFPVVIDFHGYYLWDWADEEVTGLLQVADKRDFIAVFPEGMTDTLVLLTDGMSWNAAGTTGSPGKYGITCQSNHSGYPCYKSCRKIHGCKNTSAVGGGRCDSSTCADDLRFIELMLDSLEADLCVDTDRIHLTGISNGGMMVYALAMDPHLGQRFAGIAPVASEPLLGFLQAPPHPIAIMDIHGTQDPIIPANASDPGRDCNPSGNQPGPHGTAVSDDGFYYVPQANVTKAWAQGPNRCKGGRSEGKHWPTPFDGTPIGRQLLNYTDDFYCWTPHGACSHGTVVVRCTHNAGHVWPWFGTFGGVANQRWAELIWWFFQQHPRGH